MAKITEEEVAYVAHLARLAFGPAETTTFTSQLNDILLYMEKLARVDTEGVAPMTHAVPQTNAFREDTVRPSLTVAEALGNAPDRRGDFIRVPRVID